ncbi:DUF2298 domain-containing protein [Andreprevotia chitinilytica]|uniref:DUF2298 domain-containing protein n=1 Tax=Andreprevotia chitinilytica TaxID=396808 RepID=UPI00054DFCBF|nr:DUF2298 domain-containing protein [Andreprevotia chitinilytica]
MTSIYYLLTLALILLHFAGVSALLSRWIPSFHVARAVGVLAVTLTCFFLEHFHGWGKLAWLWPFTAAAAGLVLWWDKARLQEARFIRSEAVFWVLVGYGLVWKWFFPSIFPTSERVTDLFFITNYLPGSTLPPLDHWFPPRSFDFYYAFQHYGAALMGRMFDLSPGLTYNLAMPLLMGMTGALAWDFAGRFVAHRNWRVLVVAAFIIGGTGATPFVHLVHEATADSSGDANNRMWGSARFVGLYDREQTNTRIGHDWFLQPIPDGFERRELPMEGFGYQYYVGDYHPPLGGFFLLALALALIGMVETGVGMARLNTALIGFTVPITIATNTWVFPLQFLLVGGWAAWRSRKKNEEGAPKGDWIALIIGGVIAFLLLYPFLTGFTAKSLATPIKFVSALDHTPWQQFLALHWPTLLMIAIGLTRRDTRKLTMYFALGFGLLLVFTELFYVKDPSGGRYERTNSTMKWWGWIWCGVQIALTSLLLGAKAKWVRWVTGITVAVTLLYAVDVFNYFRVNDSSDRGQLHASGIYTGDATVRDMFRYLSAAPDGIVMENLYADAYTDGGIYAIFAVKPGLLGWPSHLTTWHGSAPEAYLTLNSIRSFYAGNLPDARTWLLANNVRYIVWNGKDAANTAAWSKWAGELGASYGWQGFGPAGQPPVGIWVRR